MPKLTKRLIDATPCPATGELWMADDSLPGFGVRLRDGRKTYCLRYRTPAGQTRRENLGRTTVLTLDQARAQAQAFLVAVRQGTDPVAERRAVRQASTVSELAERYLREHTEPKKKPSSARMDRTNLRLHILPVLGKSLVAAVARTDIAAFHHRLQETPGAANLQRCEVRCGSERTPHSALFFSAPRTMFALAEQWEMRPAGSNPVRGIQRYREQKMERFLSSEELARLGAALDQAEKAHTEHPSVISCIRLLIFTGARLGEILSLRWEYIDWERGWVCRCPRSAPYWGTRMWRRLPGMHT